MCEDDQEETEEFELQELNSNEDEYQIKVHALARQIAPDTIKLIGRVEKQHMTMLIDTN